ncbi:MAG: carboxymuconolactone decarboxylase family protein [Candidatus Nanohalobium sp.]
MSSPFDDDHMKAAGKLNEGSGDIADYYKEWKESIADEAVFDDKTRELMGLAAAAATQCQYCVHTHGQKAITHGASEREVAQVIQIAAQVRAGATMSYGLESLEYVEDEE